MPTTISVRVKKQDRRDLILNAALRLFTSGGYFKASVHDIRREADVSIGSIYHYFQSKEAIAKALYDKVIEEMTDAINEIRTTERTTHDKCRGIISFLFEMVENSPETMHYIIHAKHQEFLPEEKPICSSKPFEMMKDIVEEGIVDEDIRPLHPLVAATSIFGGAIRLIHMRLDGALDTPLNTHLDETWECAWRSVAVEKN